ncbi:MAG TPA: ABC transporter ATP-binding protein [Streptosporangiaceae bacterium]|nr:ABC transporter ATP-binding protein [Streptosporangiaceae bacterium]
MAEADQTRGPETPEDRWLPRLTGYCWHYRRNFLLALTGAVMATVFAAVIPLLQRNIIDDVIVTHRSSIWPLAITLLGVAVAQFAFTFMRRWAGGRLSLDVQHDLRTDMLGSLTRLDGARQDEIHTGQLVSRSISDINMIQSLLSFLPITLGSALLLVVSVVIMFFLSPLLALIALAVGPALWFIALRSRRKLFPASWHAQQQAGEVAAIVDETVGGVRVVKGFGQEEQELERMEGASSALYASRVRLARLMARFNPALQAVPTLGQVGILALGGWLAIRGNITLGTFLAFSSYLAQMAGPVRMLTALVTIGQESRAGVIRVLEVIDSEPVITDRPDAEPLPADANGIEFDDARFGYVPSQLVLQGLSLRVARGETMAVVGASGSGKSTLSLLLPRFYDVSGGSVRVGGHDVRDVTRDSLRASIGLVMEESFLFSDTVRANIAYGRPNATDEQVRAAARAAEADEFITELPDGYDTVIGEQGLTLSGGQRQRVALARALITDPRLLLLDDATSAIDPRLEAEIHATLHRVMQGRTTLLIAHRRSTLNLADRIAVMDGGRVADVGTHEELTERSPLYRLLLSGPGDDVEGIGAGVGLDDELARYEQRQLDGAGITPELWDKSKAPAGVLRAERGTGGSGGYSGAIASAPPSPELLARVEELPPARDVPEVDQATSRAGDRNFTLRRLLKPVAAALVIGLVLDGLDALAQLALPALTRNGIDNGVETKAMGAVLVVALIGLGVAGADWLVNIGETLVVGRNGERLLYTLRVKIFAQLQRLGLDFYERELAGRIMTRMTTDVDALSSFFQTGLVTMVSSLLTFFGVLVAMLIINVELGLIVLAIMPILVVLTVLFRSKASKAYQDSREKVSVVNANFAENVAGLRVTQAYRREGRNHERFAELSGSYRDARMRAQRLIALYFPFVQTLSTIAGAIVLIVATGQVRSGALTAGALIAYLLYIDMVFAPIQELSQVFDGYQQAVVGLRRIKDLLRLPTSTPSAPAPRVVTRLDGRIELRDVRFGYENSNRDAIDGVSLMIEPGETVAMVGQTGAGKSTLVKLIARFYDVTGGAVLVDGMDVRSLDLASYRHRLGVVPQEAYLFAGTVRDAIAYGRPSASDAEVEAAARAVGAHEMISRLSGGYYHEVTERGRNLSAGQRQLLALARAQLVDPDILLLDEATAALDLASEAAVNRATEQLAARRTTIVVAHRLTTAASADRIVVMDGGRIAEIGSHDELVRAGGVYASLWEAFTGDTELVA